MSDAPFSSRVHIWGLFLASICVSFALTFVDRSLEMRNYRQWSNPFVSEDSSLPFSLTEVLNALAQGLGFALLVLAGNALRQRRPWATQPGQLLGILTGSTLVLDGCFSIVSQIYISLLSSPPQFALLGRLAVSHMCGIPLMYFAIRHPASKGLWRWSIGASLAAHCLSVFISTSLFLPLWLWSLVPKLDLFTTYGYATTASVAILTASTWLDFQSRLEKRDWQHWIGVFAALLKGWCIICTFVARGLLTLPW